MNAIRERCAAIEMQKIHQAIVNHAQRMEMIANVQEFAISAERRFTSTWIFGKNKKNGEYRTPRFLYCKIKYPFSLFVTVFKEVLPFWHFQIDPTNNYSLH